MKQRLTVVFDAGAQWPSATRARRIGAVRLALDVISMPMKLFGPMCDLQHFDVEVINFLRAGRMRRTLSFGDDGIVPMIEGESKSESLRLLETVRMEEEDEQMDRGERQTVLYALREMNLK